MSSWRTEIKTVADPRWKTPAIKLAQHVGAPVIPVWFDGTNSLLFHALGMIHPNLRTLALPQEMLRMRELARTRAGEVSVQGLSARCRTDQRGRPGLGVVLVVQRRPRP